MSVINLGHQNPKNFHYIIRNHITHAAKPKLFLIRDRPIWLFWDRCWYISQSWTDSW